MGKALIHNPLKGILAVLTIAAGLQTSLAFGQLATPEASRQLEISPLPLPRSIPPEEPDADAGAEQPAAVTVVTPGEDEPVTVVFGPTRDESDPSSEDPDRDTGADRWQKERAKRFRQVPEHLRRESGVSTGAIVPIRTPETNLTQAGELRQLDKMTGQAETYTITVGETRHVARLRVRLDACRAPADGASHGTMAFLRIWDTKIPDTDAVFSGWMFAESPALSALDHPRYDLWVIRCTTSAGGTSEARE